MKRGYVWALVALVCIVSSSCSKDFVNTPQRLTIAPTIASRVTGVLFDAGDKIGLTVVTTDDTYTANTPLTYTDGAFSGELYWYTDFTKSSILTAYYPYQTAGQPSEFTIQTDQTTGCESSDFLAARQENVKPTASAVAMTFKHLLTKVDVHVTNNSDYTISAIQFDGFKPTAEIDYSTLAATVKESAEATTITACPVTANETYQVILVPQTCDLTVNVVMNDGVERSQTLSNKALLGGYSYTLNVTTTNAEVTLQLSAEIDDWLSGGTLDDSGSGNGSGNGSNSTSTISYKGEEYTTTMIGEACWLAEDLRYKPAGVTDGVWVDDEGNVYYSYDVATGATTRAATGATTRTAEPVRGICPEGWHIPSKGELTYLKENYIEGFYTPHGYWIKKSNLLSGTSKGLLMSSDVANSEVHCLQFNGAISEVSIPIDNFGFSLRCVRD